jgi:hypothetical protein
MTMSIFVITAIIYAAFNLFVMRRISRAFYLDEDRRRFHMKFIWILPFIGPLIISGSWREPKKVKLDTMTKEQRDKRKGDFYESNIGLNS